MDFLVPVAGAAKFSYLEILDSCQVFLMVVFLMVYSHCTSSPVPQAVSRNRVQVVGIKGRPELNGQDGTLGEFYGAKGRFPVSLEGGESVLIKMMNLVAIGDDV